MSPFAARTHIGRNCLGYYPGPIFRFIFSNPYRLWPFLFVQYVRQKRTFHSDHASIVWYFYSFENISFTDIYTRTTQYIVEVLTGTLTKTTTKCKMIQFRQEDQSSQTFVSLWWQKSLKKTYTVIQRPDTNFSYTIQRSFQH